MLHEKTKSMLPETFCKIIYKDVVGFDVNNVVHEHVAKFGDIVMFIESRAQWCKILTSNGFICEIHNESLEPVE